MSRSTDSAASPREDSDQSTGYVCPFCGLATSEERDEEAACPRCGMNDTPATRKATKARIGPWHVRQMKNPWAPGMRWETLMALVRRGQVTANSIVRGPTTHQLWRRARRVKGLSREFGVCYSCGESIEKDANLCPHCNRLQEPPASPDMLLETRELVKTGVSRERDEIAGVSGEANVGAGRDATLPERSAPRPPIPVMRSAAATMEMPRPASDEDDALLSARELATAFKLDFSPRGTKRRLRNRMSTKLLAVLLLCGIIAALLYVRPEIGTSAWDWVQRQYQSLRGYQGSAHSQIPAAKTADLARKPAKTPISSVATKPKPATELRAGPMPMPIMEQPRTKTAETAIPAKAVSLPTNVAMPKSEASAHSATGAAESVPMAPVKPAAVPATTAPEVDPVDEAHMLWSKAIDAEANKDFVEAVKCYEKIKKLPAHAQPAGVDLRLQMAKKQLP